MTSRDTAKLSMQDTQRLADKTLTKAYKALSVITNTESIANWLKENDPKAFAQAQEARSILVRKLPIHLPIETWILTN